MVVSLPAADHRDATPDLKIRDIVSRLTALFSGPISDESFSDVLFELGDVGASGLVSACKTWSFALQSRLEELEARIEIGGREFEAAGLLGFVNHRSTGSKAGVGVATLYE